MASSVYNYTFTGFGTQVKIGKDSANTQTICTGASINFGQKIINSNGSFGGGVDFGQSTQNTSDKTLQANGPPRMDVPQITVSLSFQMTAQLLALFFEMIQSRKHLYKVAISGNGGTLQLNNCYWNKISLQVQQNSLMTGSVDFNVVQDYDTVYSHVMFAKNSGNMNKTNFGLYGQNFNCHLIPYYATAVKLNGKKIEFDGMDDPTSQVGAPKQNASGGTNFIPMAWSFDISQQVSLKTFCKHSTSGNTNSSLSNSDLIKLAPLPTHVAFGLVNCNLNITTLVDSEKGLKIKNLVPYVDIESYKLTSNDYIDICYLDDNLSQEKMMQLKYLQLLSATPNYTDTGNYMSCQLSYQVNKLSVKVNS